MVLILEDDAATRELYRREVGRTFRVLTSADEQEAQALLNAERVDALVLEPAALGDGEWWFVDWVHGQLPELPIVVCSILDMRNRSAELGAAAYLIKPVTPAALTNALGLVLTPSAPPAPNAETGAQLKQVRG